MDAGAGITINDQGAGSVSVSVVVTSSGAHTLTFFDTRGLIDVASAHAELRSGSTDVQAVPVACTADVCRFGAQAGQTVRFTALVQVRLKEWAAAPDVANTRVRFSVDSSKPSVPATVWLRFLTSAQLTTGPDIVAGTSTRGAVHLGWNTGVPDGAKAIVRLPKVFPASGLQLSSLPPTCPYESADGFYVCSVGPKDPLLVVSLLAVPIDVPAQTSLDIDVSDPLFHKMSMKLPARKADPTPLDEAGMTGKYHAAMTGAKLNEPCSGVGGGPLTPTPCLPVIPTMAVVVWGQLTWTAAAGAPADRVTLLAKETSVALGPPVTTVIKAGKTSMVSRTAKVRAEALQSLVNGPLEVAGQDAVGGWSLIVVWSDPVAPSSNVVRANNTVSWLGRKAPAPVSAGSTNFLFDFDWTPDKLISWTFAAHRSVVEPVASRNGAQVFSAPTSGTLSLCIRGTGLMPKTCTVTNGSVLGPTLSGSGSGP